MDESSGRPMAARGAAWRRRQRRPRSMLSGTNVRPSQWPLPSVSTTAHSARRRQGPGRGFDPQEPGTQHFFLDDDSVPDLGGSRPDRLVDVRPQERVQRRTVEQIVDSMPVVPLLHTCVPQMVDSVVEVLKILDNSLPDVEQVIEVPKISLHRVPQLSSLLEPQVVEQLVDVSVPESVILARGRDAAGITWCQVAGHQGTRRGLLVDDGHTSRPVDPAGIHRQLRAEKKLLGKAEVVAVVDVLVKQAPQAPDVLADRQWKVPQVPFIDSVLDFLFCHRDGYELCKPCSRLEIPQCSSLLVVATPVVVQRQVPGGRACEHAGEVPAVFSSWWCPDEVCGREFDFLRAFFAFRPFGRRVPALCGLFWELCRRGLGVTGTPGASLSGVLSHVNSSQ